MDQDARAAEPEELSERERSPEEIRADIDQTREELGDTVASLADKTDVKGQVQQRIAEAKANVERKRNELTAKARNAAPASAQEGGRQVVTTVKAHPAPVALVGAALAGFLLGRLTRRPEY